MVDSGIRTLHLQFPSSCDIRYLYYTRHQVCRLELCASWTILAKVKKRRLLNWKTFFRKVFSTGKTKSYLKRTFVIYLSNCTFLPPSLRLQNKQKPNRIQLLSHGFNWLAFPFLFIFMRSELLVVFQFLAFAFQFSPRKFRSSIKIATLPMISLTFISSSRSPNFISSFDWRHVPLHDVCQDSTCVVYSLPFEPAFCPPNCNSSIRSVISIFDELIPFSSLTHDTTNNWQKKVGKIYSQRKHIFCCAKNSIHQLRTRFHSKH